MADYSIIADVSRYLVEMLREKMCPELISLPAQIEVGFPGEKNQDYIVGLFLYNIEEEKDVVLPRFQQAGRMALQQSPKPYRLYYMLFINSASQSNFKSADAQKIIGRAAQVLGDRTEVRTDMLQPWLEVVEPPVILSQDKISLEAKFHVWQAVNQPYQLSLFYQAAPVMISSENIMDIVRVSEASFSLQHIEERRQE